MDIFDFFSLLHHPKELIQWAGYTGLALIVFAETGLPIGFMLPGDSLLVTAGLLASTTNLFHGGWLSLLLFIMAILGDGVGYMLGSSFSSYFLSQKKRWFIKPEHIAKTQEFYKTHGGKTIIFARFIPIVRTFAPPVAGAVGMSYSLFALYNVVGAAVWVFGLMGFGYAIGTSIPQAQNYLPWIIGTIVFISFLPVFLVRGSKPASPK